MDVITLDSVAEFIVDCQHKTAPTQDYGTPLIRTPNIGKGRFNLENVQRISADVYEQWTIRGIPEKNDLILAREAPAGNVAIIKSDEPYCLGQRTVHIRPNKKIVDPDFLVYFMLAPKQQANLLKHQVGVHVGHVNMKDIRRLPLENLPALHEQKKLAVVISNYDDLIENNRRRIQLLEESARLLYKEWFVHLRFPGHEHVKITDGVPEGWDSVLLEGLCFQVKNTVKPQDVEEGTNYIGLEHIPRRSITLSEWDTAEKVTSNKFSYKKGDLIFGKIRPYFHKVGFTLTDGIASSDAIVIRPLKNEFYFYLLALISSDYFVSLASKTVKEGSKMPRADWNFLLKQTFILPSDSLLEVFSDYLGSIVQQLETLALQNKILASSRDILLPRLMNGELSV